MKIQVDFSMVHCLHAWLLLSGFIINELPLRLVLPKYNVLSNGKSLCDQLSQRDKLSNAICYTMYIYIYVQFNGNFFKEHKSYASTTIVVLT